jgi:hypothetical protein
VTCHEVRHSHASVLTRAGLSVRVVGDRLRNADASITMNGYAQLWPNDEDRTRSADDEDRTRSAVDSLFGSLRTRGGPTMQARSPAAMPLLRRSAGTPG